ncbi:MAG: TolC family protein [Chitinophagales bacterium]
MKTFLFILFTSFALILKASDSTVILTPEQYINTIIKNHPEAKQARLLLENAKANLLSARGAFDPEIAFNFDNKTLDGKNYFQYINPSVKIPLWYGIELKGEINNVRGNNTDNELTYGNSSLAGISLPLLSGLVMNKKMATLKQAKNDIQLSKQQQILQVNNLLIDATKSYWNWTLKYHTYQNILQAKQNSFERLQFVKRFFSVGERPSIDTVEAYTQFKLLEFETQNSYYEWIKSTIELSLFLWSEEGENVFLKENVIPVHLQQLNFIDSLELPVITELDNLIARHPKMNSIDIKLKNLEIERKLKKQLLLPTLNVNYNFINNAFNLFNDAGNNLFLKNYKVGMQFNMPLLLREGRGEYRKTKIKIQNTILERQIAEAEINTKVKSYFNDMIALKEKIELYTDAYQGYNALLKAENIRLDNGESSLFLVNIRQNKVIEAQLKLLELKSKFMEYNAVIYFIAGQINN